MASEVFKVYQSEFKHPVCTTYTARLLDFVDDWTLRLHIQIELFLLPVILQLFHINGRFDSKWCAILGVEYFEREKREEQYLTMPNKYRWYKVRISVRNIWFAFWRFDISETFLSALTTVPIFSPVFSVSSVNDVFFINNF